MAFLAGAINAGGYFAFSRYTSHVTGSMSLLADVLYLQEWSVAIIATISVLCFVAGAAHSGWVILWTQQMRFRGSFGVFHVAGSSLSVDIRLVRYCCDGVGFWRL